MILGVGTDLMKVSRMRDVLASDEGSFVAKVFTAAERDEAARRADPAHYFALRFAAKEAVFKCLGTGEEIRLDEIEILSAPSGAPLVALTGKAQRIATARGIGSWRLSLTSEPEFVIAFALAQSETLT